MDYKPLSADGADVGTADMTDAREQMIDEAEELRLEESFAIKELEEVEAFRRQLKEVNERYESAMRAAIAELGEDHPVAASLQQQLDWLEPASQS